jgi:SNF2 family DNA or RNA helicase
VKSAPDAVFHPTRPCVAVGTHHSVLHHFDWYLLQHFDRIVVDEAHIMRNQGKIFENLREVSRRCQYRWGITATPFNNRDSDMTSYVKFLKPAEETVNGEDFKQYFIRKLRSEVLEGGPKLIMEKEIYDFDYPEERMMYDFVSNRIEETHDWIRTNAGRLPWRVRNNMIFVLMLRQRQASIHPQLVLNAEKVWARQMGETYEAVWDPLKVTKINKIADMVSADQKQNKNTLIVSHFSEEIRLIAERLQENKVKIRILDGKTPTNKRKEIEKKLWYTDQDLSKVKEALPFCDDISGRILSFMQDVPEVVIIQIQAGGVGISLPWIHHVINTSPDWNPFLEKQSIFRAYRVTTKHDVRVTSLYLKQTIELAIQKRQTEKMKRSIEWTDDPIESISEYIRMPEII